MKEILKIANDLRKDDVAEPIVREALELIAQTEINNALKKFNEWEQQSLEKWKEIYFK